MTARDFVDAVRPVGVVVDERITAARDVAVRVVWAVRLGRDAVVGIARETTLDLDAVVRETVGCVAPARETVDASRTAASATPMPTQHVKISAKTFLILTTIVMLAKKNDFGQGLI